MTLIFTQDVAELTTGHTIFVTLYLNASTCMVSIILKLDRLSLPLILSEINAICNYF